MKVTLIARFQPTPKQQRKDQPELGQVPQAGIMPLRFASAHMSPEILLNTNADSAGPGEAWHSVIPSNLQMQRWRWSPDHTLNGTSLKAGGDALHETDHAIRLHLVLAGQEGLST